MKPAPPVMTSVATSDCCAFGILKRQLQLLRQRIDGRAAALPGPFGLEAQITDAPAPRRDHAADRPEVAAIGVLLIQPPDDVGGHADERSKSRCRLDAVFPAVPGAAEYERDLLEVVDEELPRLFVHVRRA